MVLTQRACGRRATRRYSSRHAFGMARPPSPLPAPLLRTSFRMADAFDEGVPRHRLRARDLHRPARGVRSHHAPTSIDDLARQVALVLPEPWAYSHLTAARLYRLPLPRRWTVDEPLHVLRPTSAAQVRRTGVVGRRGLESRTVVDLRGHRVTSEVWTWADLAALEELSWVDLVVAGDAFVDRVPSLLPMMRELATGQSIRRGVRKLRRAAAAVRVGAGSPMETRARLVFAQSGLPEPELNGVISGDDGQFVARADFVWRTAKVVVEYEGDHHRSDRRQWQHDIARTRLLESLGWRVIRITVADLVEERLRRELLTLLRGLLT
jgi:hypothetical protein